MVKLVCHGQLMSLNWFNFYIFKNNDQFNAQIRPLSFVQV